MTDRTRGLKDTQFGHVWDTFKSQQALWIALFLLGALVLVLNLRVLGSLGARWEEDPNYSHGILIPFISIYFIYMNRNRLDGLIPKPSYMGLLVFLGALAVKFVAIPAASPVLEGLAMVTMVNGLLLYLGGWRIYQVLWIPALYLFFSIPLPSPWHTALALPLQRLATNVSTLILNGLFSIPLRQEGNVISLVMHRLSVEEACSGMRSILGLTAISFAFAYLVNRPMWEKVVLVASTLPLAITANVLRIVITALLHEWGYSNLAEGVYHTLTGWVVFLFALAGLLGINWLLGKLWVEEAGEKRERR